MRRVADFVANEYICNRDIKVELVQSPPVSKSLDPGQDDNGQVDRNCTTSCEGEH